jgi:Tfp pilus assembly protein PilO
MKSNETTMYVVLLCVLLILGWMFVLYSPLRSQTQHVENMINRRIHRIETRATLPEPPTVSAPQLQKELDAILVEREKVKALLDEMDARYVRLDRVDELRELRLAIANEAKSAGLDIVKFGSIRGGGEISDSLDALNASIRQPYGRPVLNFRAKGDYGQITDFVQRIGEMERSVAILRLNLVAPEFEQLMNGSRSERLLSLDLDFAL